MILQLLEEKNVTTLHDRSCIIIASLLEPYTNEKFLEGVMKNNINFESVKSIFESYIKLVIFGDRSELTDGNRYDVQLISMLMMDQSIDGNFRDFELLLKKFIRHAPPTLLEELRSMLPPRDIRGDQESEIGPVQQFYANRLRFYLVSADQFDEFYEVAKKQRKEHLREIKQVVGNKTTRPRSQ